jgi:hypothetical protein
MEIPVENLGYSMSWLLFLCGLLLLAGTASAQMIRNDAIGNDPAKERLCVLRANAVGKTVPFEIDSGYVARSRSFNPDVTFIAIDGMSPQLVECYLRKGTGRYEPATFTGEVEYWHLIKPQQFKPGINTDKGISMASNVCLKAVPAKINRPKFDHSVYSWVGEVNIGSPLDHPGALIAGKIASRYDIVVDGTAFYKSVGPDLAAVKFTCLLSPMLELKAIQFK